MNHKAVYRTAPATPGLLKILKMGKRKFIYGQGEVWSAEGTKEGRRIKWKSNCSCQSNERRTRVEDGEVSEQDQEVTAEGKDATEPVLRINKDNK